MRRRVDLNRYFMVKNVCQRRDSNPDYYSVSKCYPLTGLGHCHGSTRLSPFKYPQPSILVDLAVVSQQAVLTHSPSRLQKWNCNFKNLERYKRQSRDLPISNLLFWKGESSAFCLNSSRLAELSKQSKLSPRVMNGSMFALNLGFTGETNSSHMKIIFHLAVQKNDPLLKKSIPLKVLWSFFSFRDEK